MKEKENPAIRHLYEGDELIKFETGSRAKHSDFNHPANVIFIHGFTAHGNYLHKLAKYFDDNGFNSFIYNYNSYRGIEEAAKTLRSLLFGINRLSITTEEQQGVLQRAKFSLVCHSMGGLVGRALTYQKDVCHYIKHIVTLGTPHSGTLGNSSMLESLIKWGEFVTEAVPGFTLKSCLSALELTSNDPSPVLLDRLQNDNPVAQSIPVLAILGGRKWLDFSTNALLNAAYNKKIQKFLQPGDNDGLVSESSSSLKSATFGRCLPNREDFKDYTEYEQINHSNLITNQDISITIMTWLKMGSAAIKTTT